MIIRCIILSTLIFVECVVLQETSASTVSSLFVPSSEFPSLNETKVPIKDIPYLIFIADKFTNRVRTNPGPQLNCISGCIGELPAAARCINIGMNGLSVRWECKANVVRGRKLEQTRVRCEAYTKGDPNYILADSCALDYSLGVQADHS